jgi:predicted transcriptional regulator
MTEENIWIALQYFKESGHHVDWSGLEIELAPRLIEIRHQTAIDYFVLKDWINETDKGFIITEKGVAAYERRQQLYETKIDKQELEQDLLNLNKQLMERQIAELDKKDEIIRTQRNDLNEATNKTTQATWKGAILGAVITIAPTIWLAYMKSDKVVLPSIQVAHDTTIVIKRDTIYLPDSLKKR